MVYDSSADRIVLFGGNCGPTRGVVGDTWLMKNDVWSREQYFGPPARTNTIMVFADNRTVLFGGLLNSVGFDDTWEWNGKLWVERQNMGPTSRHSHSMTYDSNRQRIVLFGGYQNAIGPLGDTWELKIQTTPD
jgi:Galactose oxidase, central domain